MDPHLRLARDRPGERLAQPRVDRERALERARRLHLDPLEQARQHVALDRGPIAVAQLALVIEQPRGGDRVARPCSRRRTDSEIRNAATWGCRAGGALVPVGPELVDVGVVGKEDRILAGRAEGAHVAGRTSTWTAPWGAPSGMPMYEAVPPKSLKSRRGEHRRPSHPRPRPPRGPRRRGHETRAIPERVRGVAWRGERGRSLRWAERPNPSTEA